MVAVPQFASAQPVVQPLPAPAAAELREALQRLSRNPDSLSALVTAGRASLELDDSDAAHGFFTRAEAVAPNDGRVLAGLALVELARENPVAALRLFDRAEAAGESMEPHAAQRGLAYDLVGMNDSAQSMYRQALARGEDPVVVRRLALSQAIAGNAEASEATLLPLLQAQDLSAYRTRAFALAIAGRPDEAVSIAETMLPARLSRRLAPYLRYMPRLTRAQQAAAANFGTFPDASEIGRDDPEIAAFTAAEPQMPVAGGADSRLIPGGEPLGPATAQAQAGAQPPTLPAGPAQQPAGSEVPVAASISAAQPAVPREERRIDLSEVFADFELPSGSPPPPSREAVDLTRITPRARGSACAATAGASEPSLGAAGDRAGHSGVPLGLATDRAQFGRPARATRALHRAMGRESPAGDRPLRERKRGAGLCHAAQGTGDRQLPLHQRGGRGADAGPLNTPRCRASPPTPSGAFPAICAHLVHRLSEFCPAAWPCQVAKRGTYKAMNAWSERGRNWLHDS